MNEILPNNAVPPGFRCAPPGEQAPLGGRLRGAAMKWNKATMDFELFRYESSALFQLLMKLDKKKPGKDDLNVWSSPDWNAFNVAVLELLCIAERQLR
jgi:hypothetical protein